MPSVPLWVNNVDSSSIHVLHASAKLNWAHCQTHHFSHTLAVASEQDFGTVATHYQSDGQTRCYRVKIAKYPIGIAVHASAIINALRSVLDYIAQGIVSEDRRNSHKTAFPLLQDSREKDESAAMQWLTQTWGMSKEGREFVDIFQVNKARNAATNPAEEVAGFLRSLGSSTNEDKHRNLIPLEVGARVSCEIRKGDDLVVYEIPGADFYKDGREFKPGALKRQNGQISFRPAEFDADPNFILAPEVAIKDWPAPTPLLDPGHADERGQLVGKQLAGAVASVSVVFEAAKDRWPSIIYRDQPTAPLS